MYFKNNNQEKWWDFPHVFTLLLKRESWFYALHN